MGCVSASGVGVEPLWRAARDGISGVRHFDLPRSPGQHVKIAAPVPDFDPEAYLDAGLLRFCDRFSQLAIVAADEAMTQAGFSREEPQGERTAVIVGSGIGGANTNDDGHYNFYVEKNRTDPMTIPRVMPNAAASQVCMRYGCKGPSFAISSACSSGSQSIGVGFQMVRCGLVDRAVVGGSEALLTPAVFRAWEALRVLTPDTCRPFSKGRNGMVLGEGAAVLIIEELETARARNAPIIAEIAGYGSTSDANDIVRPDRDGPVRSMRLALADAGLAPEDVGYINAHGTGTILNDIVETAAVRDVFGACADRLAVTSTKPIHGHTLGAAGAIELVVTIKALAEGVVPPTVNWIEADPKCDLDVVPNEARRKDIDVALSNSFAFGGINASLVVRHAD
jgi:nodulation protein E